MGFKKNTLNLTNIEKIQIAKLLRYISKLPHDLYRVVLFLNDHIFMKPASI